MKQVSYALKEYKNASVTDSMKSNTRYIELDRCSRDVGPFHDAERGRYSDSGCK